MSMRWLGSPEPGGGALLLGLVVALLLGGCDSLDRNELKHEVQSVNSVATEGALLADQAARGRTLATFARVHARELAQSVDETAQSLNDVAVPDDLRSQVDRAIKLAGDTSGSLGDIETSPNDAGQAAMRAAQLRATAAQADQLAGSL